MWQNKRIEIWKLSKIIKDSMNVDKNKSSCLILYIYINFVPFSFFTH